MVEQIFLISPLFPILLGLFGMFQFFTYNPAREIDKWINKLKKERKRQEKKLKMRLEPYKISVSTVEDLVIGVATLPGGGSFQEQYRVSKTRPFRLKLMFGVNLSLGFILYLLLTFLEKL